MRATLEIKPHLPEQGCNKSQNRTREFLPISANLYIWQTSVSPTLAIGNGSCEVRFCDRPVVMWLSPDPARQFAGLYSYTGNGYNPINAVDPDGNQQLEIAGSLGFTKGIGNVGGNFGVVLDFQALRSGEYNKFLFLKGSGEGGMKVGFGETKALRLSYNPSKERVKTGFFSDTKTSLSMSNGLITGNVSHSLKFPGSGSISLGFGTENSVGVVHESGYITNPFEAGGTRGLDLNNTGDAPADISNVKVPMPQ